MFRLDYLSCALTILSTVLVGRRRWHGWLVAGANSLIICYIGYRTAQTGFIPANVFCLAIYGYNVWKWRNEPATEKQPATAEWAVTEKTHATASVAAPPVEQVAHTPRRITRLQQMPALSHRPRAPIRRTRASHHRRRSPRRLI